MKAQGIKLAVSVGCLAALLWWTNPAEVLARLRGADVTWTLLSLLAVTAATFLMASRWKVTAGAFGIRFSYLFALREYYLAQLINSVLPGGVAGDVARAFRARGAADLTSAAQSVMAERLLGQIAILGLMFAGFAVALLMPGGPAWTRLGWIVLMVLAGCGVVTWVVSRRDHAMGRFMQMILRLIGRPVILLHGAITTLCLIFGFYACARATGTVIPAEAWATLIPLVLCAMMVPLSVGGWGWREGAAAALFPIIGAPSSAGIATGITYGVVIFVAALPAAAIPFAQSFSETLSTKGKPDLP
ncbi:lysylphosphatidylglycerol synthase transmembrane domain-containing protein [Ruegeria jejuensis]|uniref:lysylphosphatidylglycerol synthase transmembrane domain-containing protein n=1 Tax=Ruegeria jejuensis TaxID=3233338 RepID=UPI00355B249F